MKDKDDVPIRATVTVLAGEVDRHAARLVEIGNGLADLGTTVAALHRGVAVLTEQVRARRAQDGAESEDDEPDPPWLLVDDQEQAVEMLAALVEWLGAVYVRYPNGSRLPACWAWHPSVVAELIALRIAWLDAFTGQPNGARMVDWHDRHRPGVVQRIAEEIGACSLTAHAAGGPLDFRPPYVPATEQAMELAAWWATSHGSTAAPAPTPSVIAEVDARMAARSADRYR